MRYLVVFLCSPLVAALLAWIALGACVDEPIGSSSSIARLVAAWDPLACGDPHRVAIELEDDAGASVSASAPCSIGGLTVDVSHFGSYHGRIYAWVLAGPIRSIMPLDVTIDQPIVQCMVATPQ